MGFGDRRKPLGEVLAGRGRGLSSPGERRAPPGRRDSRHSAPGGIILTTQEISQFDTQRESQSVEDINRNASLRRFHLTHIRLTDTCLRRELLLGPVQLRSLLPEIRRQ